MDDTARTRSTRAGHRGSATKILERLTPLLEAPDFGQPDAVAKQLSDLRLEHDRLNAKIAVLVDLDARYQEGLTDESALEQDIVASDDLHALHTTKLAAVARHIDLLALDTPWFLSTQPKLSTRPLNPSRPSPLGQRLRILQRSRRQLPHRD